MYRRLNGMVSRPIRVLFDVDSLAIGGLEKEVVRLALGLDRSRFEPALGGALQCHF